MTLATFYQSKPWRRLVEVLKQERVNEDGQLICEYCGRPILRAYDCIGHHKTELTEENVNNAEISLNPANVELIHFRCHNEIHDRWQGTRHDVFLVYGPPCAGKTTWVESHARKDDLVLDLDRIWEAICLSDRLHKPARLRSNVFGIRDVMIEQIRIRKGMWRAAYVIGGYPLRSDRDRLCEMLGARAVYIDESREICLERAETDEWRGYIEDWFEAFTP